MRRTKKPARDRLTPGKLADLIVLDRDIFAIEPMEIAQTQVIATMIDGQWVWQS